MASITKRGKTYRIKVSVGYDADGKQKVKTMTYTPAAELTEKQAEKEAKHQAMLFEERVRNGISGDAKMKFSDFADFWLKKYAEPNLKAKTVARYKGLLVRIDAVVGFLPLNKITPSVLLDFYDSLTELTPANEVCRCSVNFKALLKSKKLTQTKCAELAGISGATIHNVITEKNISTRTAARLCEVLDVPFASVFTSLHTTRRLSPSTIRHYHRLLSDILGTAVKWQYLPYNPTERVDPPKTGDAEISYLDDAQSAHLLQLLKQEKDIYRYAISLLLLTGLRRGELLGLEWQDIDFAAKTMYVRRTSQYLPRRGVYTDTPKTKKSKRLVMISDQVIGILRSVQLWQERQSKIEHDRWMSSRRIITNEVGAPMNPDRLTQWFSKFVKRTDLPEDLHLHSLRHTYATLCIAKGVPLTAVAAQLGHANVATTATIYAHAIKTSQIAAADKIGRLFADIV